MRIRVIILLVSYFLGISLTAEASDLCKSRNLGWHFYCDPKKKEEHEIVEPKVDSKTELKNIQEKLESLKVEAVIHPTLENVANYIAFQNEQMEKAGRFASIWKKVLIERPDLDLSVRTPMSTVGNELLNEIKQGEISKAIGEIKERYGVYFIYNATCPYCVKYSPILKAWSEAREIDVFAVSLDGSILPEWPKSEIDRGQAIRFGLKDKPVPATLLFDNKTKEVIPLGFGLLSMGDLEERLQWIISERVR